MAELRTRIADVLEAELEVPHGDHATWATHIAYQAADALLAGPVGELVTENARLQEIAGRHWGEIQRLARRLDRVTEATDDREASRGGHVVTMVNPGRYRCECGEAGSKAWAITHEFP